MTANGTRRWRLFVGATLSISLVLVVLGLLLAQPWQCHAEDTVECLHSTGTGVLGLKLVGIGLVTLAALTLRYGHRAYLWPWGGASGAPKFMRRYAGSSFGIVTINIFAAVLLLVTGLALMQ